jgi:hypothetical protein
MIIAYPTDEKPLELKDCYIYPSRIVYKNQTILYEEINHIKISSIDQNTLLGVVDIGTTARKSDLEVFLTNTSIKFKANKVSLFNSNSKVSALRNAARYLLKRTFDIRFKKHKELLQKDGYFEYDGTKFYSDGTIVTRKNNSLHLQNCSLKDFPGCVRIENSEDNKIKKIGRNLIDKYPNTNFYKNLIHGELTIKTDIDQDIFYPMLRFMYEQ